MDEEEAYLRRVEAAKKGDRASMATLLRGSQDSIYRFCLSKLRSPALAAEATQETALRLIRKIGSFRGDSRFTTWALGIAYNVCRESIRDQKRRRLVEPLSDYDPEDTSETQPVEDSESGISVAMEQLTEKQKTAVTLRYFESLSISEISQVMGVAPGTVKATLNQAIKKLKLHLPGSEN